MKKFFAWLWDIAIAVVILFVVLQVILYTLGLQIVDMP